MFSFFQKFKFKFKKVFIWIICFVIFTFLLILLIIFAVKYYTKEHPERYCFYNHITDAIEVNKKRKVYYSEMSNGQSEYVSSSLIKQEKKLIPWALLIDFKAQKFIKEGSGVVCKDFVSMKEISSEDKKIEPKNISSLADVNNIKKRLEFSRNNFLSFVEDDNFNKAAEELYALLLEIESIEEEKKINFCMTKHVIESAGIAAWHAERYSSETGNEINPFLKLFLKVKGRGLNDFLINLDHSAQKIHLSGLGIICNDVPAIPFKDEFKNNS